MIVCAAFGSISGVVFGLVDGVALDFVMCVIFRSVFGAVLGDVFDLESGVDLCFIDDIVVDMISGIVYVFVYGVKFGSEVDVVYDSVSVIGVAVCLMAGNIFNLEVGVITDLVVGVVFSLKYDFGFDTVFSLSIGLRDFMSNGGVFGSVFGPDGVKFGLVDIVVAELPQAPVIQSSTTDPINGNEQAIAVVFSSICGIVFCVMFCSDFAVVVLN